MELIAQILTNPTTGALDADWPVRSDDVRTSQRRIEPRFPTNRLTAIYWTGSGGPERMFCSILDVSQHGMRVRTARPLTPGAQVRVTLREISALARVCYSNRATDGFDHGLHVQEFREKIASS
jgi:PilZ domain-containing protein